jgi:hypothetical protein
VLREVDSEKVEVMFLEGIGNERAIVRVVNLSDVESDRSKKERGRLMRLMENEQKILNRLKDSF